MQLVDTVDTDAVAEQKRSARFVAQEELRWYVQNDAMRLGCESLFQLRPAFHKLGFALLIVQVVQYFGLSKSELVADVSPESHSSRSQDGRSQSAKQSLDENLDENFQSESEKSESELIALRLLSPIRSTSVEALQAEVVAAEAALALRAQVDGLPVVYDSPAVSISLRKVSPAALQKSGTSVEAPDGASINIPADPRVKGRYDTPVTISVTSYHAGDAINKDMPKIKFTQRSEDKASRSLTNITNITNITNHSDHSSEPISERSNVEHDVRDTGSSSHSHSDSASPSPPVDRVDFFMTKTSVTWHGTVNVKVPGLSANVPARDRPWTPLDDEQANYAEEKAEVKAELERLASLPSTERLSGYRKLAKKWHPDKHPPEEREKVTEIFEYLQEPRLALGSFGGSSRA